MSDHRTVDPSIIFEMLKIDPKKQQDICEFLSTFLEFISTKFDPKEPNDFTRMFSSVVSRGIDIPSDSFIFFNIPVIENGKTSPIVKRQLQNAHFVGESSDLFFVQIQRMIYNKESKSFSKNCGEMDVIEELDLTEFGGKSYQLYAVSYHIGSGFAGHYITFLKDSVGWLKMNDEVVTPISEKEFYDYMNRGGNETPYLLAYITNMENVKTYRNECEAVALDSSAIPEVESNNATDNESNVNILSQMSTSQSIEFNFENLHKRSMSTYFMDAYNDSSIEDFTSTALKPEPRYKVNTKIFDPLQFRVINEVEEELTKQQLKDMVQQFEESNMNVFFSLDGKHADNAIPQELWVTQKPLYIYTQSNEYRIFDIEMYDKPFIELTFTIFQTIFKFSFKFDPNQTTQNIREYVSNFLFKHLDMVEQNFELLVQNKIGRYYLLPSNSFTTLGDLFIQQTPVSPLEEEKKHLESSQQQNKNQIPNKQENRTNHITIAFQTLMPSVQENIIVKVYTSTDTKTPSKTLKVPYRSSDSINDVMKFIRDNAFLPTYFLTVKRTPKTLEPFPIQKSVDDLYRTSMNYEVRVQERPSESTFQFVDADEHFIFMHDIDPNMTLNEIQIEMNKKMPNCIIRFTPDGKSFIEQKDFYPMTCKDGYFVVFLQNR